MHAKETGPIKVATKGAVGGLKCKGNGDSGSLSPEREDTPP